MAFLGSRDQPVIQSKKCVHPRKMEHLDVGRVDRAGRFGLDAGQSIRLGGEADEQVPRANQPIDCGGIGSVVEDPRQHRMPGR